MTLEFGPFRRDAEFQQQRALFSECFPENRGQPPETRAFYERKFAGYPAAPRSYEYVARDEVGLAGYYAALPYSYAVDGERFRCGMVCDVMTAARLRGKGVFTKLGAYSLQQLEHAGVDFVSGYPRRPEVIPGHLKVGWSIAFKLPMYLAPLRTGALLRSRLPKLGVVAPLADRALGVARLAQRAILPNTRGLVTRVWPWRLFLDTFDVDAFGERWRATVKNALVKSREFLTWRLSVQEADYFVVTVQRAGELVGVSIVRPCVPEGVPSLALVDVMWLGSPAEVIAAMRERWEELARDTRSEALITMMSEHRARELGLWRYGFVRTPVDFSLILKPLSGRARARLVQDAPHWNPMWIDSDDL